MFSLFVEPVDRGYARDVGHAHVSLCKEAGTPVKNFSLRGQLYLSKSGWLLLSVPNNLGLGAFAALREIGTEVPKQSNGNYNAHITVMSPDEVESIGGAATISERGHHFSYTLGPVKEVSPNTWKGVSKVWYITAESPELSQLRKSYGLTPLRNGYDFHITFAIRKTNVLRNNDTTKAAAEGDDKGQKSPVVNIAKTSITITLPEDVDDDTFSTILKELADSETVPDFSDVLSKLTKESGVLGAGARIAKGLSNSAAGAGKQVVRSGADLATQAATSSANAARAVGRVSADAAARTGSASYNAVKAIANAQLGKAPGGNLHNVRVGAPEVIPAGGVALGQAVKGLQSVGALTQPQAHRAHQVINAATSSPLTSTLTAINPKLRPIGTGASTGISLGATYSAVDEARKKPGKVFEQKINTGIADPIASVLGVAGTQITPVRQSAIEQQRDRINSLTSKLVLKSLVPSWLGGDATPVGEASRQSAREVVNSATRGPSNPAKALVPKMSPTLLASINPAYSVATNLVTDSIESGLQHDFPGILQRVAAQGMDNHKKFRATRGRYTDSSIVQSILDSAKPELRVDPALRKLLINWAERESEPMFELINDAQSLPSE